MDASEVTGEELARRRDLLQAYLNQLSPIMLSLYVEKDDDEGKGVACRLGCGYWDPKDGSEPDMWHATNCPAGKLAEFIDEVLERDLSDAK